MRDLNSIPITNTPHLATWRLPRLRFKHAWAAWPCARYKFAYYYYYYCYYYYYTWGYWCTKKMKKQKAPGVSWLVAEVI